MRCPVCSSDMIGDGFRSVYHCSELDLVGEGFEADSGPIYCDDERLPQYIKDELKERYKDEKI